MKSPFTIGHSRGVAELAELGCRALGLPEGDAIVARRAGLLHDLDYERHPDPATHGAIGADELERRGYPEEIVHAVRSHNDILGIPRASRLDHLVYSCDELAGFLVAVALMCIFPQIVLWLPSTMR